MAQLLERAQKADDVHEEHGADELLLGRLTKAMKAEAASMGRDEARYLVDAYYQIQDYRKSTANQVRAGQQAVDAPPMDVIGWLAGHMGGLEGRIAALLKAWALEQPVGAWSMSITGVGPIIAAGLLAHIDIRKAPTAGHVWRFAGLDPSVEWLGKDGAVKLVHEALGRKSGPLEPGDLDLVALATNRRAENIDALMHLPGKDGKAPPQTVAQLCAVMARKPWNGDLKTLCWKIGECFVKVSGHEDDVYGHAYQERKAWETQRNLDGLYREQAERKLARFNIGKDTDAYKAYSQGMLPPAHLNERAKRWAVKLFLSHWHHVAYEVEHGRPPDKPYILSREEGGHTHYLTPPNWPM